MARDDPITATALAPIRGEGGKGGGRSPREAPDDLFSDSTAYIVDVLSEGPIEGWADPAHPARCIYFDGTPLENPDGTLNFDGVDFELRTGTEDQASVPGFSAVENQTAVGVEVTADAPVVRAISNPEADALRVTVSIPSLVRVNSKGDRLRTTVAYVIETQVGSGPWVERASVPISGKTRAGYDRATRIELPPERPVNVRVRRLTPDSTTDLLVNQTVWSSYTEIIDAKLAYPNTAYVALAIPAEAFGGRLPMRSYRIRGMQALAPSNYDPVARTYSGLWNGVFQRVWTRNPVWALYTALVENRWGLGERIDPSRINKFALYEIAAHCDELVDDGAGGQEPRYSIDGALTTPEQAHAVIQQLSGLFRGVTWFGGGAVQSVDDRARDPVALFTPANVIGGDFDWSSTALGARKTMATAAYRDPDDHYRMKTGVAYDDAELIERYGEREIELDLPFTTRRGEAMRACRWAVETNGKQRQTVTFATGLSGAPLRPGDNVLVQDPGRIGYRAEGRLRQIQSTRLRLDRAVALDASRLYSIWVETAAGLHELALADGQSGALEWVDLAAPKTITVRRGSVFAIAERNMPPRRMRVLTNRAEFSDGALTFIVTALEEDPNKHARVETGVDLPDLAPYRQIPLGAPSAPTGLEAELYWRPDPGSISKLRAALSWRRGTDARVSRWRVLLREPGGRLEDAVPGGLVYAPDADILLPSGALEGAYEIRVRAETAIADRSPWAVLTIDPTASGALPPSPPSGLAAVAGLEQLAVSWTRPDTPELRGVEVAWSTLNDVAGAQIVGEYAADGVTITNLDPDQAHYVWARTVTHAEQSNLSAWAGPIVATPLTPNQVISGRGGLAETALAGALRTKIDDASTQATTALDSASAVAGEVASLTTRVAAVETETGEQAGAISSLEAEFDVVSGDLSAQASRIAAVETVNGNQATSINNLWTNVNDAQGSIASINARLATVETDNGDQAGAISSLEANYNAVTGDLSAQAGRLASVEAVNGAQASALTGLEVDVNAIDGRLSASATLQVDVNGRITGARAYDDGQISSFDVRADVFRLFTGSGAAEAPFVLQDVNGVPRLSLAGDFFADRVLAEKLIVGGAAVNLNPTPGWTTLDPWQIVSGPGGFTTVDNGFDTNLGVDRVLRCLTPNANESTNLAVRGDYFPVVAPGDVLSFSASVSRVGANSDSELSIFVLYFAANGSQVGAATVASYVANGIEHFTRQATVPDGARRFRIQIAYRANTGRTAIIVGRLEARRAEDGTHIGPRAIKAVNADFESLTALGLTVQGAEIENLTIQNANIANAAIDTLKLGAGSVSRIASAYTSGLISLPMRDHDFTVEHELQRITIVKQDPNSVIQLTTSFMQTQYDISNYEWKIKRGATVLANYRGNQPQIVAFSIDDANAPLGSSTYTVTAQQVDHHSTNIATEVRRRFLKGVELKR